MNKDIEIPTSLPTLGFVSYPTVVRVISPHQKDSMNVQVVLTGMYRVVFLHRTGLVSANSVSQM